MTTAREAEARADAAEARAAKAESAYQPTRAPEPVAPPTVLAFESPGTHRPEGTSAIGLYRTAADLDGMTPEAIVQAQRTGQLDYLLGTTTPTKGI